jgi:hypothetical protein
MKKGAGIKCDVYNGYNRGVLQPGCLADLLLNYLSFLLADNADAAITNGNELLD